MDENKLAKIKNAIKNHFEDSPEIYVAFEEKYGFFKELNARLATFIEVKPGSRILDIGCGAGASSKQMLDHIPDSCVVGLDNSPAMLRAARLRYGESTRLSFVEGDAASLANLVCGPFDAVVYSASIFLIPDYQQSLRQASELLNRDGVLGVTFMDGVYDAKGQNFLAIADQSLGEGISLKKAVTLDELLAFFQKLFRNVRSKVENFELSRDALKEFYSVPAMSAGLFPKFPYPERLVKVQRVFSHAPQERLFFRWVLIAGRKTPQSDTH
ncbi:MAG: class I SAM-dependent methyltransferase [Desulfomonilaceae bacterium]